MAKKAPKRAQEPNVESDAEVESDAVLESDAVIETELAPEQVVELEPDDGDEPVAEAEPEPVVEEPIPPLADVQSPRPVLHSRRSFTGRVWDITSDLVNLGEAGVVTRDYVHHPGAVAILALNDEGAIYLVRQYRHPVRTETWEPPAGLLDVSGEDPLAAAKRELFEEADLIAERWDVLADFYSSPGGSSEGIRMYLARDITDVPHEDRHEREAEERDMAGEWVALRTVLAALARGDVQGPTLAIGAYALDAAMRSDFANVRPARSPWRKPPARGEH